tara:strand:+ start:247 stop:549 length:303 start_codon:yes stop_codon:yes gene_type:complete
VREFTSEEFGGSKTQRVTAKAKEGVGVQPAVFYGPKPIEAIPNGLAKAMLASLLETAVVRRAPLPAVAAEQAAAAAPLECFYMRMHLYSSNRTTNRVKSG